jgi:hypothetical protein
VSFATCCMWVNGMSVHDCGRKGRVICRGGVRTERYLKVVVRFGSFRKQQRVVVEKMVRRASVVDSCYCPPIVIKTVG